MQAVVSQAKMLEMDKRTCEQQQITPYELMQRAGNNLAEAMHTVLKDDLDANLGVVVGIGNNGGDGLIIAGILKAKGYNIDVIVVGDQEKLKGEAKDALNDFKKHHKYDSINKSDKMSDFKTFLKDKTVIIDALFGIGLSRDITGFYKVIIDMINHHDAVVHSVDIPSGIDTDNGTVRGIAVKAHYTWIVQCYKFGNFMHDALDYHGKTTIVDIDIVKPFGTFGYLIDRADFKSILHKRKHHSHKYDYGSIGIFGGSEKMMGAPSLSALGALRSGAGLATIIYHTDIFHRHPFTDLEVITDYYETIDDVKKTLNKKTSLVFGPGLGRDEPSYKDVLIQLIDTDVPLIIDADGLYYYGLIKDDIKINKPVILTPHGGEILNLLAIDKASFYENWLGYIWDFAIQYNVIFVLKGPTTVIVDADHIRISPSGNPSMAKAGSGDVLSGVIATRLSQNHNVVEAVQEAVLLHGLAGDIARDKFGESGSLARDIIDNLANAERSFNTK